MTRRFTSEIINQIGPEVDIPAPDVGTDGRVMAWMFDTYSMNKGHSVLGVVTGKPLTVGGSLGREEATARGALYVTRDAIAKQGRSLADQRIAVQGFGNVGSFFAKFVAEDGARVVAISDSTTAYYNPNGIDVQAAFAQKRETRSLAGLKGAEEITNEELLVVDCDILAPCALEQVITDDNAAQIKAKMIVEGANGPITPTADAILEDMGVLVLPDVLANAGGVIVSYFEWVQGLQEYFWKEAEVEREAQRHRHEGVRRDVGDDGGARHVDAARLVRPRRSTRRRGDDHARHLSVGSSSTPRTAATSASRRARCSTTRASRTTRWTSRAIPRSRRSTASGCLLSRSTASARSSTASRARRCGAG